MKVNFINYYLLIVGILYIHVLVSSMQIYFQHTIIIYRYITEKATSTFNM